MAKYTKKQISDLTGMPTNKLAVYIQRGKLVLTDGLINDANETNRVFIERHAGKKMNEPVINQLPNMEENDPGQAPKNRETLSLVQLERQKKLADLHKVEVDTRIAKLKEEKLIGQNIPVELVRSVIAQLSKSFVTKFKDGSENLLISVAKMKGLKNDELAKLRGELITIINESIRSSVSDGKRTVGSIVDTYSSSRGIGEHD